MDTKTILAESEGPDEEELSLEAVSTLVKLTSGAKDKNKIETDLDAFNLSILFLEPEKIPVSKITLNSTINRIKTNRDVAKLYDRFNVYAWSPITVAHEPETDQYEILRGQSRFKVYSLLLQEKFPYDRRFETIAAYVYHGLTQSQKAQIICLDDQGQKKFSAAEFFHTAVKAEQPEPVAIAAIFAKHDIQISRSGSKASGPNSTSAVAAMWDSTHKYHLNALDWYLGLRNQAFRDKADSLGDLHFRGYLRYYAALKEDYPQEAVAMGQVVREKVVQKAQGNPDKFLRLYHANEMKYPTDNRDLLGALSVQDVVNYQNGKGNKGFTLPSLEKAKLRFRRNFN